MQTKSSGNLVVKGIKAEGTSLKRGMACTWWRGMAYKLGEVKDRGKSVLVTYDRYTESGGTVRSKEGSSLRHRKERVQAGYGNSS